MDQSKNDNGTEIKGMESYSYYEETVREAGERIVIPEKVSYGDAGFKNFDVREVFINGKPKDEYYVRIRNNSEKDITNAAFFLANKLGIGCDVGVIDPGNKLHLDFHIYIKVNDELMKEAIMSMMEDIDSYISSKTGITKI